MTSTARVLQEIKLFYRRNDIEPDEWLSPLDIYPARFEDREKRKLLYQLVTQGDLEETLERYDEYRIRVKQEGD